MSTDTLPRTGLSRWRNAALYAIAVLVTAASLAAFTESYRGLYYWSREHGLTGFWAYAWPIQLDAFIAVGELALFVALADRWPKRWRIAAWCVAAIGAAVSTAGNVGHMAGHGPWAMVTAGVPPVAAAAMLMVALGILKHVLEPRPQVKGETVTAVTPMTEPAVTPPPSHTVTIDPELFTLSAKQLASKRGVSQSTIQRERRNARTVMASPNGKAH